MQYSPYLKSQTFGCHIYNPFNLLHSEGSGDNMHEYHHDLFSIIDRNVFFIWHIHKSRKIYLHLLLLLSSFTPFPNILKHIQSKIVFFLPKCYFFPHFILTTNNTNLFSVPNLQPSSHESSRYTEDMAGLQCKVKFQTNGEGKLVPIMVIDVLIML